MTFLRHLNTCAILISLFLLLGSSIYAGVQSGVIVDGRVIEERTGKPIPQVSVVLFGGRIPTSAATDSTGTYRLNNVPPGAYTLDVDPSRVRHVSTRITVTDQPHHVQDLRTHKKIEIKGRVEPRGWKRLMVNVYGNGSRESLSVREDGTFPLWLVEGEYRLGVNIPTTHVVKSMRFGSRDLLKNPLVVREGMRGEIRIVLAAKPASAAPIAPSPAPRLPHPPPPKGLPTVSAANKPVAAPNGQPR
jgi:hypothetical protein